MKRRSFLRGAGGVAIGLPFLEAFAPRAFAQARPKRLVIFHVHDGVVRQTWAPTGTGTSFSLGPIMAPLEPHKKDLTVLRYVDSIQPGDAHGVTTTLSGAIGKAGNPKITTIDQVVGPEVRGSAFAALQFGVNTVGESITYKAGAAVPPENFPERMFERMFGAKPAGGAPAGAASRTHEHRQSVLDAVMEEIRLVSQKVSAADRARLERHLTTLRDVEKRVTTPVMVSSAASCKSPASPPASQRLAYDKPAGRYDVVGKAQIDLLVLALACGLTNVAVLQWAQTISHEGYEWLLGRSHDQHGLAHASDGGAGADTYTKVLRDFYMVQFERLIAALKAYPEEPGGSIFSNSVVVWNSNMGNGGHSKVDLPYVLAGSCGGALKTGHVVEAKGAKDTQVLVTLAQAVLGREPAALPRFGESTHFSSIPALLA